MKKYKIIIGKSNLKTSIKSVQGEFNEIESESFYKISNYDNMDPFLINVVSGTDHWMYISSNGGLTAGRKNPDNALFPYYTDDKIHDSNHTTGNKTLIKVTKGNIIHLWEPFSNEYKGLYSTTRNLYKNTIGTKIIFEEINHDLNLTFQYSWTTSEKFGFVKESKIINDGKNNIHIDILDGITNILPSGIYQVLQNEFSTLIDGYKKSELLKQNGMGIYSLSSILTDKAEPNEALTATTVWSTGIKANKRLLSIKQISKFKLNIPIKQEEDAKGIRGAYLVNAGINLPPKKFSSWFIVAETNQNRNDIALLNKQLNKKDLYEELLSDIGDCNIRLKKIVAMADGLQLTNQKFNNTRHFANVLFNVMRGGVFEDSYTIEKNDFISFINDANPELLKKHSEFFNKIDEKLLHQDLLDKAFQTKNSELIKLSLEYLPLSFSRRHGDPSRPWNRFSIDLKDKHGNRVLNYQGNWRDIFQNWESLALSFPQYVESMITKFLNASTADGYNPYRVTRDGFDWEIIEPDAPWANIGYWGDHQIIYLLRLLELSAKYYPKKLDEFSSEKIFVYANVPYRIKGYDEILKNPYQTIEFDFELDKKLKEDSEKHGSDSKCLKNADNTFVQANLVEKILVPLLVKLSNFIPGGGIWMNTQRPEWNDANNALVGNGISMVTLCYIRRHLSFLQTFFEASKQNKFELSKEVIELFGNINKVFNKNFNKLTSELTGKERKLIVDQLGKAGSIHREKIYNNGFSGKSDSVLKTSILEFIKISLDVVDYTIRINKRSDGLFHSYNIIDVSKDEIKISHLYEMLEGQVAVLSSGYLSTQESIRVLTSLRKSRLYRQDQNSYILYPNRALPLFIEKNNIPKKLVASSKLFEMLLKDGNKEIISKDIEDNFHFNDEIHNANALRKKLKKLKGPKYQGLLNNELPTILQIYEATFNHKEFTGRSGTFYKYEGLGSIYWHMVSKLLLSVQEIYFSSLQNNSTKEQIKKLKDFYTTIKAGIGLEKSPDVYGAFPTDPYSHTPSFAGVQQPGMTGQVKEDIISRFGELGVVVKNGILSFKPELLNKKEFIKEAALFEYFDTEGNTKKIKLPTDSLVFTYCQVPIIYKKSKNNSINVKMKNGEVKKIDGQQLDEQLSKSIYSRMGEIEEIVVNVSY